MPLAVLLGLFGPLFANTWYSFELQQRSVDQTFALEADRVADLLASGIHDPLWNLMPNSGRQLISSALANPNVRSVRVETEDGSVFLQGRSGEATPSQPVTLQRDILHDGRPIGRLEVVLEHANAAAVIRQLRGQLYLACAVQFVLAFAVVLIIIRVSGARERERVLTELNEGLAREIEERKKIERQLLSAKEDAQIANHSKSQFLANVSHELRTPLNAIIGFSDILRRGLFGPIGNEKYADYVGDIHRSGQHLLSLIDDLLDISRIEAGALTLNETCFDVAEVVRDCVGMLSERARQKDIRLVASLADKPLELFADLRCTRQILLNLLTNAVKFTPNGGRVEVAAAVDQDGMLRLTVSDNGIGISEDDLPRALEPFRQVSMTAGNPQDGAGLGLPLSRAMAELHGGELTLSSTPGQGTTVSVVFPDWRSGFKRRRTATG